MKNNNKNAQKMDKIMGIKVISRTTSEVLTRVKDFISHNKKFYIVTPNPEIILASIYNEKLKKALNEADLSIPDGVGLKVANPSLKIIKGRELFLDLVKLAGKNKWRIFLLGGLDNEAEVAAMKLKTNISNLLVEFDCGPKLNEIGIPLTEKEARLEKSVIDRINKLKPKLLFVAFGNPRQEIWIYEHLKKLNIGGAMCVGGTFRYIAGKSSLPPKWFPDSFEWLWRVITEPKRVWRIFKSVVVFPVKILSSKLSGK